jgi:hypothetical protein
MPAGGGNELVVTIQLNRESTYGNQPRSYKSDTHLAVVVRQTCGVPLGGRGKMSALTRRDRNDVLTNLMATGCELSKSVPARVSVSTELLIAMRFAHPRR